MTFKRRFSFSKKEMIRLDPIRQEQQVDKKKYFTKKSNKQILKKEICH